MGFDVIPATATSFVFFDRRELNALMQLYGREVAAGEWRDYAVAGLADVAIFSIFERAAESPIYRIEKWPAMARRQGAWSVTGRGGAVLRRGHELAQVLRVFDTRRLRLVE